MLSQDAALKKAAGEIGYSRWSDPKAGSKYGRWYALMSGETWCAASGVPYCAMFCSWCLQELTWSVLPSYNCDQIRTRAAAAGLIVANVRMARAGDLVMYDWNHDGSLDHIGIVEENCGSYLITIEGNTSTGNVGSQGNGGVVARRRRSWGCVACVVRPPYDAEDADDVQAAAAAQAAAQAAEKERLKKLLKRRRKMEFITRPNEKDYLVYFDGTHAHKLVHPDEAQAVRMAYRNCYGEELPSFEMGTKVSPWFTRFMDAMDGSAPDDLDTLRK